MKRMDPGNHGAKRLKEDTHNIQTKSKEFAKATHGSGNNTFTTKVPGRQETEKIAEDSIRNESIRWVRQHLRQARRCEQVTHRLGMVHPHREAAKIDGMAGAALLLTRRWKGRERWQSSCVCEAKLTGIDKYNWGCE